MEVAFVAVFAQVIRPGFSQIEGVALHRRLIAVVRQDLAGADDGVGVESTKLWAEGAAALDIENHRAMQPSGAIDRRRESEVAADHALLKQVEAVRRDLAMEPVVVDEAGVGQHPPSHVVFDCLQLDQSEVESVAEIVDERAANAPGRREPFIIRDAGDLHDLRGPRHAPRPDVIEVQRVVVGESSGEGHSSSSR